MDFDFTDDQTSLRDAVARWVEKGFSFGRRHGIAKAGGKTRDVYRELAELGLTGLAVPEAFGLANPMRTGASSDLLSLIPFVIMMVILYLVGREKLLAPKS